jgi:hypothetical protein
MNNKAIVLGTAVALVCFQAGSVAGYLYAKSKLGDEFDERLKTEVAEAKRFYSKLHKRDENDMPAIVETSNMLPVEREAAQAMQHYQGNNTLDDTPREEPEFYQAAATYSGETKGPDSVPIVKENNIFDSTVDLGVEAYENLVRDRTEEAPYVITLAEFMNNEHNYEQDKLVYFQGDQILVDDRDEVVDNPDEIVGDDNVVKFGHFSGDPNLVYVRNDRLGHDFEITRHEGKYAFVVLGFESENVEV